MPPVTFQFLNTYFATTMCQSQEKNDEISVLTSVSYISQREIDPKSHQHSEHQFPSPHTRVTGSTIHWLTHNHTAETEVKFSGSLFTLT
jgi:hypothetical protein